MNAQVIFGQLLVGLINGSFYAMMSLGLAIIFGLLGIANIAQGAFYMMGAFFSWMLLRWFGIGYFPALILVPLAVGLIGMAIETAAAAAHLPARSHVRSAAHVRHPDVHQGLFVWLFATAGRPYPVPAELRGGFDLGFMFLPKYRAWVVSASLTFCLATWLVIEKTPLGRTLRAATENPNLTRAFGVNVPALMTFGFGVGVALAGAAGLLAAPIYSVSPLMGGDLVIVVFAVVVIGGHGLHPRLDRHQSLAGPARRARPRGLSARREHGDLRHHDRGASCASRRTVRARTMSAVPKTMVARVGWVALIAALLVAPWLFYPLFLVKVLCYALFACAFNLLLGSCGLMSFGHAAFFGSAAYVAGHAAKEWGLPFEASLLCAVAARAARRRVRLHLDPPSRHLLRDDHARARAADLFPRAAIAVHARGGRPYRHPARQGPRAVPAR